MTSDIENTGFRNSCFSFIALSVFLCAAVLCVYFFLPASEKEDTLDLIVESLEEPDYDEIVPTFVSYLNEASVNNFDSDVDSGLKLYREPTSRAAVEWFYIHVAGNKDVALAILSEAEKNDIPLSLAFALAHTESRYNARAVNRNTNSSIDRGLFQLNSNSFTFLEEEEFFDPKVSAKYGMSHLKFCMKTAGNEVSALAMYNAGTNKVRSNRTPQSTLNYIGKIMNYQEMIDKLFAEEVSSYFETQIATGISIAMANKN